MLSIRNKALQHRWFLLFSFDEFGTIDLSCISMQSCRVVGLVIAFHNVQLNSYVHWTSHMRWTGRPSALFLSCVDEEKCMCWDSSWISAGITDMHHFLKFNERQVSVLKEKSEGKCWKQTSCHPFSYLHHQLHELNSGKSLAALHTLLWVHMFDIGWLAL